MSHRRNKLNERHRRSKIMIALERPELRLVTDGFERRAPAGLTSAPIKVQDAATRRMIDEALAKRGVKTA